MVPEEVVGDETGRNGNSGALRDTPCLDWSNVLFFKILL